MQRVVLSSLFAVAIYLPTFAAEAPKKVLHFEISVSKEAEIAKGGMVILSDIFATQGFKIEYEELPLQRGLEELQRGRLDGATGRTANLKEAYNIKNYERLQEPITYSNATLWCHKDYLKKDARHKLKLVYLRGSIVAAGLVKRIDPKAAEATPVNSFHSGASMLVSQRVDCMLAFQWTFEDDLKGEFNLKDIVSHALMKHAYYVWISARLLPFKDALDRELRTYRFPENWARKYRNPQLPCGKELEVLCPDGKVFARE